MAVWHGQPPQLPVSPAISPVIMPGSHGPALLAWHPQGEGRQGALALSQGVARRVGTIDMDLQV